MPRAIWLLIGSVLAVVLITYSGGVSSPYLVVLALMIASCAYWYGARVTVALGVIQAVAIVGAVWTRDGRLPSTRAFVTQMALLVTLGAYIAWLSRSERSERDELLNLGTEAEAGRQQLSAVITNMSDAVVAVDPTGVITLHNEAARLLLGVDKPLNQQTIHTVLHLTDTTGKLVKLDVKGIASPQTKRGLRLKTPDGNQVDVAIKVAPFIVSRQNRGYVLILSDTSQSKTINQEREEFVAVAAHELRTPLAIAEGNISLLLSPALLPKNLEAVDRLNGAQRSLRQLARIIDDLTNLARADTQQLEVELEPLNPVRLLTEFKTDYADQVAAKGLSLATRVDSDSTVATTLSSNYMVREILTIFINNALKFTEHGTITLAVERPKDRPEGVTFSVSDTGPGISRAHQSKVFEKFFQSETYMTRIHGGTGLGLFIAKKLADRLTGEVWFESEPPRGSIFYLWVPPYSRDKQDQGKVASAETKDLFDTL